MCVCVGMCVYGRACLPVQFCANKITCSRVRVKWPTYARASNHVCVCVHECMCVRACVCVRAPHPPAQPL